MSMKSKQLYFNGIYHSSLDKFGPFGRWVRHKLLHAILLGVPVLTAIQKHRTKNLDKLMHFLSFLGTEDFYTPIVVILAWVVNVRFARLFTILMGIGFYLATSIKNILQLPRPPSPPVHVLEVTYDWALPSLHSIIGVLLPWYIWSYTFHHFSLSQASLYVLFTVIFFWSSSVMFSRVYLGVHSPADIVTGGIVGMVTLCLFLQVDDILDYYLSYSQTPLLNAFIWYILILILHPGSNPPTRSYGETVVTNSVAFGMILARSTTKGSFYFSALSEQPNASEAGVVEFLLIALARILIGFPLVLLVRSICKAFVSQCTQALCKTFGIPFYSFLEFSKHSIQLNKHYTSGFKLPPIWSATDLKEPVEKSGDSKEDFPDEDCTDWNTFRLNVDTPTKFCTYMAMSWVAAHPLHYIFNNVGLSLS